MMIKGIDCKIPPRYVRISPRIISARDRTNEAFLPICSVNVEKMSMPPIDPTKTKEEKRVIVLEY
jgi:hypothetical protein